jgi:hypothetical protein
MTDFGRLLEALASHQVKFVIIGGVAATIHGSARLTNDLGILYARDDENIRRLVAALQPLNPYLRGAPAGLPFQLDEKAVHSGLNFTLTTAAGAIDLLGEIAGVGPFSALTGHTVDVTLFGTVHRCIDIDTLITATRAAGRPKDLEVAELEAIRDGL